MSDRLTLLRRGLSRRRSVGKAESMVRRRLEASGVATTEIVDIKRMKEGLTDPVC